jgi:hypothetical protein
MNREVSFFLLLRRGGSQCRGYFFLPAELLLSSSLALLSGFCSLFSNKITVFRETEVVSVNLWRADFNDCDDIL